VSSWNLHRVGLATLAIGCAGVKHPASSADAGSSPPGGDAATVVDAAGVADLASDRWAALDLASRPEVTTNADAAFPGNADAACATQSAMAETLPPICTS
jgi:hypothetical protein